MKPQPETPHVTTRKDKVVICTTRLGLELTPGEVESLIERLVSAQQLAECYHVD